MKKQETKNGRLSRLSSWFPDREFFMRSEGRVRFIKISARTQKFAAAGLVALMLVWVGSLAVMAGVQYFFAPDREALLAKEARIASSEERIAKYSDDIDAVASDLDKRQDMLEATMQSLPADLVTDSAEKRSANDTVSDSSTAAAETVKKVSTLIPEASALAQVEARQLAFAERLTRLADRRSQRSAAALRRLGLNPQAMLSSADTSAMGGPLEMLVSADGKIDPRFERLSHSLARMNALERALKAVPQVSPASADSISSGFGYRRDPFNGRGAMHSGLDFRGSYGAPIHAASAGVVSFVGWKSGYGRTVEISHANGLMTRYAHMARWGAVEGQKVAAGHIIGAIGSSGRSTGPHLHFEVRINDRAVNPRPFLEKAPNVLKEARRGSKQQSDRR